MAAATILVAAATAVKAIGAITQANAQSDALKSQAAVSRYNATISQQQSQQALRVSDANQRAQDRQRHQILGNQRAAAAQAGVGLGGTTDDLYVSPDTSAMTVGGTASAGDTVYFRVYRKSADSGDTLAVDARLHSVVLYLTTDAENDA